MKLNPFAQEWQPPAPIEKQLGALKIGRGGAPQPAGASSSRAPQQAAAASSRQPPRGDIGATGGADEELQFEDVFERPGSTADRDLESESSTPRSGLVGPSLLPTPLSSPLTAAPLLAAIEAEEQQAQREGGGGAAGAAVAGSLFGTAAAAAAAAVSTAGPQPEVIEATSYTEEGASAEPAAVCASSNTKYGPNDFELLRVVGQGAFGKVFQVRKKDSGEIFAMKVMRKDRIVEREHGDYVRAERNILTSVLHPYIVTLRYSFQTPHKLYLVLDFINGGHLFFQLYRQGTFDEPLARLYTAEIVLAIAHLHSLGFVHRDLKPENVLLDSEGHIRVSDFGLAKGKMHDEQQRSNSFIGTMEYMSPEIIAGRGHSKSADWWSVGVLLYEMLCGVAPFRAKGKAALQKLITNGKPKMPSYLSSESLSLLKGLLQKDPTKRLGYGPSGSQDVMKHAFFRGIDWKKLEQRQVPSPFKPKMTGGKASIENFDKIWTDLPVQDSPCPTPRDASLMDCMFEGFSYVAPSFLGEAAVFEATGGLQLMKAIPE